MAISWEVKCNNNTLYNLEVTVDECETRHYSFSIENLYMIKN